MNGAATRPRWRRIAAMIAAGCALSVAQAIALAPTADAHAFLVGTDPVDGATLDHAPTVIRLRFSESVALDAMTITLVDSHGREFHPTSLRAVGTVDGDSSDGSAGDTEEPVEIVADLPPLGREAYRLSWRALSSDDLHRTDGLIVFGVGEPVAAAGWTEPSPNWIEVVLRWSIFLAFAVVLGGLLLGRVLERAAARGAENGPAAAMTGADAASGVGAARARAHALQGAAAHCRSAAARAAALGVVTCAAFIAFQWGEAGAGAALLGAHGAWSALRVSAFLWLAAVLRPRHRLPRRRQPPTKPGVGWPAAAAIVIAVSTAELGHSSAGAPVSTRIAADAAHLLAGATWTGGVLLVTFVLVTGPRGAAGFVIPAAARGLAVSFAVCVGVLIPTGLYLTSGVVGSVDAALVTFYGRALLVKVVLVVAVMGVLGAINHRRLRRPTRRMPTTRPLRLEAAAGACALLMAAVLTSSQPAREPQFVRAMSTPDMQHNGQVGDIQYGVAIRPNTPGPAVVLIDAFDTRRPTPAPIRSVRVRLVSPTGPAGRPLDAQRLGDGRWSAGTEIRGADPFDVQVTIRRTGLPDLTWNVPWTVGPFNAPIREPLVSNAPIGGALKTAAAVTLLLGAAAAAILGARRRTARSVAVGRDSILGDHAAENADQRDSRVGRQHVASIRGGRHQADDDPPSADHDHVGGAVEYSLTSTTSAGP